MPASGGLRAYRHRQGRSASHQNGHAIRRIERLRAPQDFPKQHAMAPLNPFPKSRKVTRIASRVLSDGLRAIGDVANFLGLRLYTRSGGYDKLAAGGSCDVRRSDFRGSRDDSLSTPQGLALSPFRLDCVTDSGPEMLQ